MLWRLSTFFRKRIEYCVCTSFREKGRNQWAVSFAMEKICVKKKIISLMLDLKPCWGVDSRIHRDHIKLLSWQVACLMACDGCEANMGGYGEVKWVSEWLKFETFSPGFPVEKRGKYRCTFTGVYSNLKPVELWVQFQINLKLTFS